MPHEIDNRTFYEAVSKDPNLKATLARYKFKYPELKDLPHGTILKLSRTRWVRSLPNRDHLGVDIHFECANNRRLHLHIETWPYEANLDKNPKELARRQPELELREQLHRVIRPDLQALTTVQVKTPTAAHQPDDPSANSAGSFRSNDDTPEGYATFVASVIDAVFHTVDRHYDEVMRPRTS